MNVGGQRTSNGNLVDPGLLLSYGPHRLLTILVLMEIPDQLGPHDAALDFDETVHTIELDNRIEGSHVQMDRIGTELLPPHRMTTPGDRHRFLATRGFLDRTVNSFNGVRHENRVHLSTVHTRLNIVDFRHVICLS